ncbi:hypothetical protein D3C81_978120 [compost metagenome]
MHDLLVQVHVRVVAVHRQRRGQLDHTDQHQRRHFAGGSRHGEDQAGHHRRAGHRQDDFPQRLRLGRAQCQRAFTRGPRDARQAFLGGDDHHRHGEDRQGQRGPEQARGAEGRRRGGLGEEQAVQGATQHVDEEAQAEHAVDDRRNTGEVVHSDADDAGQRPLPGIFAQVDRGDHTERGDDHRHHQGHHHGAEDGREDAALGVRFARVVAEEFPELLEVEGELLAIAHGVGLVGVHQLAEADLGLLAAGVAHHHAVAIELLVQGAELFLEHLVAGIQLAAAGGQVGLGLGGQLIAQLQAAFLQTQALQAVVDAADVLLLQPVDLRIELIHALHALVQLGHGARPLGDHLAVFLDAHQVAVEVAVLTALQGDQIGRRADVAQPLADDPGEVAAIQVAVAQLEQFAGHELRTILRHRKTSAVQALAGHLLALHFLADQGLRRLAGHVVGRLDHVRRPEVAETTHGDHRQQTDGHDHRDGHRTGVQPHPGRAAGEPRFDGFLFLFHRGMPRHAPLTATRISSAAADESARPGCSSRR